MSHPAPASTAIRDLERILWIGAAAALLLIIVRTAWLSDDAYITLRTIDNWRGGFGLRWNVAERVQAYTHPLWLFAVAAAWAITGEHYFSTLTLSIVCAMSGAVLLLAAARPLAIGAAAFLMLLASPTFVDYATSGLETPLTYLLLAIFCRLYWSQMESTASPVATLMAASLVALNRLDTAVLLAPAILHVLARAWPRRQWSVLLGLAPIALWEAFSVCYYGFPFPNTAYAKLATKIPQRELTSQGLAYLANSWHSDPIALSIIAAAVFLACWRVRLTTGTLAAGLLLHLTYVVRVGGDFMSGRFLAPTLFVALGVLLVHPTTRRQRIAAGLVIATLMVVRLPVAFARDRFRPPFPAVEALIDSAGIADERRIYVRETGLLDAVRRGAAPHPTWEQDGRRQRSTDTRVVTHEAVGLFGFGAGPTIQIVDRFGLGDPLLARMPAAGPWRIGHFRRALPDGYIERLRGQRDTLVDPALNAFYEDLRIVTRDPLWSRRRWAAILRVNFRPGV